LLGQWWLGLGQNDLFLLVLLDFDLCHFVHLRLDTACIDSIELPPPVVLIINLLRKLNAYHRIDNLRVPFRSRSLRE